MGVVAQETLFIVETTRMPASVQLDGLKFFFLKLELLGQHKARAAKVSTRAHWVEKGEKNTKLFFNLEKSRANAKIMDCIKNASGQSVSSQRYYGSFCLYLQPRENRGQ